MNDLTYRLAPCEIRKGEDDKKLIFKSFVNTNFMYARKDNCSLNTYTIFTKDDIQGHNFKLNNREQLVLYSKTIRVDSSLYTFYINPLLITQISELKNCLNQKIRIKFKGDEEHTIYTYFDYELLEKDLLNKRLFLTNDEDVNNENIKSYIEKVIDLEDYEKIKELNV